MFYFQDVQQFCALCGKQSSNDILEIQMTAFTESSNSTFACILNDFASESKLARRFDTGNICGKCKEIVCALDKLQQEVLKVKKSLLQLINNDIKTGEIKSGEIQKEIKNVKEKITIKKKIQQDSDSESEEEYNVEALLEKRGYKYLVKWENYSEEYNSWEPRFGLPPPVLKVYLLDNLMFNKCGRQNTN